MRESAKGHFYLLSCIGTQSDSALDPQLLTVHRITRISPRRYYNRIHEHRRGTSNMLLHLLLWAFFWSFNLASIGPVPFIDECNGMEGRGVLGILDGENLRFKSSGSGSGTIDQHNSNEAKPAELSFMLGKCMLKEGLLSTASMYLLKACLIDNFLNGSYIQSYIQSLSIEEDINSIDAIVNFLEIQIGGREVLVRSYWQDLIFAYRAVEMNLYRIDQQRKQEHHQQHQQQQTQQKQQRGIPIGLLRLYMDTLVLNPESYEVSDTICRHFLESVAVYIKTREEGRVASMGLDALELELENDERAQGSRKYSRLIGISSADFQVIMPILVQQLRVFPRLPPLLLLFVSMAAVSNGSDSRLIQKRDIKSAGTGGAFDVGSNSLTNTYDAAVCMVLCSSYVQREINSLLQQERYSSIHRLLQRGVEPSSTCGCLSVGEASNPTKHNIWSSSGGGGSSSINDLQQQHLLQLHVGCSDPVKCARSGWTVVDIVESPSTHVASQAFDLSAFDDVSVSIIYSSHTLEHLSFPYCDDDGAKVGNANSCGSFHPKNEVKICLREWYRVLQVGGQLFVSVPDVEAITRLIANSGDEKQLTRQDRQVLMSILYGGQETAPNFHKSGFFYEFLEYLLLEAGFCNVARVNGYFNLFDDTSQMTVFGEQLSLNVVAQRCKH